MDGAAAPLFEVGRREQQIRRPLRVPGFRPGEGVTLRASEQRRVQHGAGVRAHRVPVHGRPEAVETSRRGEDGEVREGAKTNLSRSFATWLLANSSLMAAQ